MASKQLLMTREELQQAQLKLLELKRHIRWQTDPAYRENVKALEGNLFGNYLSYSAFVAAYFDLKQNNIIR